MRGFSDSLRHELEGTAIGVTTVHPGGIATSIAKSARMSKAITEAERAESQRRFERLLTMPAERAGELIAQAIERRRPRLLIGSDAKLAAFVERLTPAHYWKLIGRGWRLSRNSAAEAVSPGPRSLRPWEG